MISLLSYPSIYLYLQGLIGAKRARRECVRQYISYVPGQRVLDVGCGPGYVIEYLPECDYVGFDTDQKYINYARNKYGHSGIFFCQEFCDDALRNMNTFDLVIMNGLLHHLDNNEVIALFKRIKCILRSGGQVVTLDGCYVEGQSSIARRLLGLDRGKYVRDEKTYVSLASEVFGSTVSHIRHDLLRVPYSLIIMQIS
jgi:SAM-dependent methyltransferase